jgi:DNA-directed RNA polymerase sigma subunit (sigma70/sigma32)
MLTVENIFGRHRSKYSPAAVPKSCSFSAPVGDGGRVLQDLLADRLLESAEDDLGTGVLNALSSELSRIEKTVVLLRCGFALDDPLTLEEIGRRFSCSAEWI